MATELTRVRRAAKVSVIVLGRVRRESEQDRNPRVSGAKLLEGRRAGCGDPNRRGG